MFYSFKRQNPIHSSSLLYQTQNIKLLILTRNSLNTVIRSGPRFAIEKVGKEKESPFPIYNLLMPKDFAFIKRNDSFLLPHKGPAFVTSLELQKCNCVCLKTFPLLPPLHFLEVLSFQARICGFSGLPLML